MKRSTDRILTTHAGSLSRPPNLIAMSKAIGCDIGQGYLFAKPMPKAEFVAALSRRLVGPPKLPAKPRTAATTTLTRGALADT